MLDLAYMNRTSVLVTLAELGPVVAFFIAGRFVDFYVAVAILMSGTVIAVATSWYLERHVPLLPILSALFVLIGGAATLLFKEADAIIIADTVYYVLIASLLLSSLLHGQLILKNMFGLVLAISDEGWRILSWRWFWFMTAAAVANEVVRILATPEFWVDYRFYKTIVVILFACYQFTVSRRYRLPSESTAWGVRLPVTIQPNNNSTNQSQTKP